jgi:hypothetical protein
MVRVSVRRTPSRLCRFHFFREELSDFVVIFAITQSLHFFFAIQRSNDLFGERAFTLNQVCGEESSGPLTTDSQSSALELTILVGHSPKGSQRTNNWNSSDFLRKSFFSFWKICRQALGWQLLHACSGIIAFPLCCQRRRSSRSAPNPLDFPDQSYTSGKPFKRRLVLRCRPRRRRRGQLPSY